MKSARNFLSVLVFLMTCLFATNAFAQAADSGFELRAGLGVPIFEAAAASFTDNSVEGTAFVGVGISVDIEAIYRWTYFGIGVEQQFGGAFAVDPCVVQNGILDKGDGVFLGATYFMLKEYIPINDQMMITIGEGIGAKYGANLANKRIFSTDTDASFAVKADLGFTYFIMNRYGVGINLEYNASLAFGNGFSLSWGVTPALTFDMIF